MNPPDWTEKLEGAGDHQGRWALGLESMGFRISRALLPPLTNTTERARYYSFYCWVYWTFAQHQRKRGRDEATYSDQKAWRVRLENAFRTSTVHRPDYSHGLIGKNSSIALTDDEPYPIGRHVRITAWQAAYYKPSWLAFGLGHLHGDIVVVDPTRGVPLARAFDERVRAADPDGTHYPELVSFDKEIRPEVLEHLGYALALRPLEDEDEKERLLLVDRLFHLHPSTNPDGLTRDDWKRSLSLTLLLDLVASGAGNFTGVNSVHHVLATGRFPSGGAYTPPGALETAFQQWERYQERQQEKLALYAYWDEVRLALRDAGGLGVTAEEILGWIFRRTEQSEALRTYLGEGALDRSVKECLEKLGRELGGPGEVEKTIQALADHVMDGSQPNKAGSAALLLLLLSRKWKRVSPSLPVAARQIHTAAARRELPLPLVAREVRSRQGATLRHLVRHTVEQWVLAQSLRVALEKWSSNQDRFFIARDQDGYRIVRNQKSSDYLGYDRPRIQSSLQILQDVRLVEQDDGGYRLTSHGERLREEALAFHAERLAEQDG